MSKNLLEYIKVVSMVIMAVSLSIIAWNHSKEISYLQDIDYTLEVIKSAIRNMGSQ